MSHSLHTSSRQPALPSSGGLLGRDFAYRTAEKTDVRLTWQRAKQNLQQAKSSAHPEPPALPQP